MSVDSFKLLVVTRIVACVVAMPVLTLFMDFASLLGGLISERFRSHMSVALYVNRAFSSLTLSNFIAPSLKTCVFGFIIGSVSSLFGYTINEGSAGVPKAATNSVVLSSLLIILSDVLLVKMIYFFFPGAPVSGQHVEFKQVSKSFEHRKVLDNVSFVVNEGEVLCVLGRSGTGKSVTLKLMIGLLKPDSGSVWIGSEDISKLDREGLPKIRRDIGFLFQSAALFDSFTVADNLALPVQRFDKKHKSPQQIQAEVKDMLSQVGLEKDMNKLPGELSGGMKKRVGLARALVLNPKVLLVDEPSSGLDRITASEIDELLMKFNKERKTTTIIVTHDVRGTRRLADKVAVLDQGSLVGFGTIEEIEHSENDQVRELISESQ